MSKRKWEMYDYANEISAHVKRIATNIEYSTRVRRTTNFDLAAAIFGALSKEPVNSSPARYMCTTGDGVAIFKSRENAVAARSDHYWDRKTAEKLIIDDPPFGDVDAAIVFRRLQVLMTMVNKRAMQGADIVIIEMRTEDNITEYRMVKVEVM